MKKLLILTTLISALLATSAPVVAMDSLPKIGIPTQPKNTLRPTALYPLQRAKLNLLEQLNGRHTLITKVCTQRHNAFVIFRNTFPHYYQQSLLEINEDKENRVPNGRKPNARRRACVWAQQDAHKVLKPENYY